MPFRPLNQQACANDTGADLTNAVLTGANLPMLLKFFNSQESLGLDELAGILKSYGQQSIALASEYLKR